MELYFTETNQPYLEKLFKALFMASYYGLLHAGEVTKGPYVVLAKNVFIGENKDKILFILRTSKTHDLGDKPQEIKFARNTEMNKKSGGNNNNLKLTNPKQPQSGNSKYCPFTILSDYLAVRPDAKGDDEQFFVFSDGTPVKPEHMRSLLKTCLEKLDLDPSLYNLHSLRIGRCQDMLKLGLSV